MILIPGVGLVNQGNGKLVPGDGITQWAADVVTHSATGVVTSGSATTASTAARSRIRSSSGAVAAGSAVVLDLHREEELTHHQALFIRTGISFRRSY